ncbi:hypothetical protein SGQ44_11215 [Flavobacterium sp. Fl-77]|uniref:Secreted protein n=1 Tax=Flavobacterium flavipigmentatum TaxID=2893884 RepID=A0AAJ2SA08_9FLAO|nr:MULTISPECIES: hypothetical protein [unclassified Flavobacterium]MDX6182879.1 hypothetical protein [Flavobacterium sp. Fl-33]MDX6186332.1 hypothetical protein [Flavobacterium sp. Fl-77]UFH37879.1 hypothetical protein LNP22_14185 [Flavobacterium sp. F-70]
MKRIFFTIMMMAIALQGYAQKEMSNKYRAIPPADSKMKEIAPPKEIIPRIAPLEFTKKPDSLEINPEELFKNTMLYKKEANTDGIFYRRNQFLGNFKTKAFVSTIRYRDAAFVDGDKIKVYLNDKIIEPQVGLNGEFQGFKINLVPGINKIDFEALNEGSASPNTAEFQVYDDKGVAIEASQWNVGTGYKATIVLIKE